MNNLMIWGTINLLNSAPYHLKNSKIIQFKKTTLKLNINMFTK